ncbi:hypothetical protein Cgig2_000430 [Carnegiea gigantea]|uniref:Uncharacterized protein n=1 Tax=Carnegiea gigantea TaxID=171969 RepID=A0A9Q1Q4Q2_9CARY|nr:hypothetical protein Cgig2_000430 [Carnegiea gigantea]
MPTTGYEPSYRNDHMRPPKLTETETVLLGSTPIIVTIQAMNGQQSPLQPQSHMQRTPNEPPGSSSRSRHRGLEVKSLTVGGPQCIVRIMNAHEVAPEEERPANCHTKAECRELRKALNELADKGQIDRFLKRGSHFLQREREPARPEPRDEECSIEVMATIAGGYAEGITRSTWKAQLWGAQQVLTAEQGTRVTVPAMVFGGKDAPRFTSLHNDPLVVEMKVASEVNPIGMIRLHLNLGDEGKAKNLEVDFLVVDVPAAYNIILGWPTLHKGFHHGRCRRLPKLHRLQGKGSRPCHPETRFPHLPGPPQWRLADDTPPTQDLDPRLEPGGAPRSPWSARAPERIWCTDCNPDDNLGPLPCSLSRPRPPLGSEPPLAGALSPSSRPPRPLSLSLTSQSDACTWPLFPPIFGARPQGHVAASPGWK